MAPQPRSQTSPPKPWEQRPIPRSPAPDPALMSNMVEGTKADGGIAPAPGAGSLHPQRNQHRLVSAGEAGRTLPGGVSSLESARGASPADGDARSRYTRGGSAVGGAAGAPGTRSSPSPAGAPSGQAKNEQGVAAPSKDGGGGSRMEGAANWVANASGGTAAVANTTDGQQWKPQASPGAQGPGAYGGYGTPGYGSGRYGTSYGTGHGSNYTNGYSPGGYGG